MQMEENYEGDDFEPISQPGTQENIEDEKEDEAPAPAGSHRMRLSIDIHSIKDSTFKGLIYAKHSALPTLGIKPFISAPPIQIVKANIEETFKNSFRSYEFTSTQQKLYATLAEAGLEIEVWHQDRFKKDILIGVAGVDIQKVLSLPVQQTPQSFVRTYDSYVPLDEIDENRRPVRRVGLLRVIVYLEDLGPADYLKQHEKDIKLKYKEELDDIATVPATLNLNMPGSKVNDVEKVGFLNELSNLEYKIIWELENWKKAEEAKFKYQLKSKEVDFLKKLNEDWKKKESEREKIFKKSEAQVQAVENKLKQKTLELQKREQRLILLEEELKQKISETSRQLAVKDEELNSVKKRQKDDKTQYEKEKAIFTAKSEEAQAKLSRLQDEYMAFKKEQETSPVNLIKNELSAKDMEIIRLKGEVEKAVEIKNQFEAYYERMKKEIIELKKENQAIRDNYENKRNSELEALKMKINTMSLFENKENFRSFRNEFQDMQVQYQNDSLNQSGKNPFTKNYLEASDKDMKLHQNLKAARTKSAQDRIQKKVAKPGKSSEYDRLVEQREQYLSNGYAEDDGLIKYLNEEISKLEA